MAKLLFAIVANIALLAFRILGTACSVTAESPSARVCAGLSSVTSSVGTVLFSSDPYYEKIRDSYWSATAGDLRPACIALPTTGSQISGIVTMLQKHTDVRFAVASGGHGSAPGFSSVEGGVLISLKWMNNTELLEDKATARVGPGAKWSKVMQALEPHGLAVVGARLGDVGVGGCLLAGCLSFLSGQYGLGCDTVDSYEVVLADGSLVHASSENHSDLYKALKGGGNQFGIVVSYTMRTFPIGPIWGGILTYAGNQSDPLMEALHDYTTNYDPKSAIIVSCGGGANSSFDIINLYVFYNAPEPPAQVFEKFLSVPFLNSAVKTQNYSKLITSNGQYAEYGSRWLIQDQTFPNLPAPAGVDLYKHHYNAFKATAADHGKLHPSLIYSTAFQPLPVAIAHASKSAGGNVLGLSPEDGDRMWIDYNVIWDDSSTDADSYTFARDIVNSEEAYVLSFHTDLQNTNREPDGQAGLLERISPLLMNNAQPDQPVLQRYGFQTYDWLRKIQRKYDPEGLWFREGGFKYT